MAEDNPSRRPGPLPHVADEALSQTLLPVADQTVLLVTDSSPLVESICKGILDFGMRPILIPTIAGAPEVAVAPRYSFIDSSLPGARAYITALSRSSFELSPIAIVESPSASADAYAAGATSTVQKPLHVDEVLACLSALRARRSRRQRCDVELEHTQRATAATAFDSMLRTLTL